MRLEKPLPDSVYRELLELHAECEELDVDFDLEDRSAATRRAGRVRERIQDLIRASEAAQDRREPT